MLPEIKKVRDEARKCHAANGCVTIQEISNIFQMFSPLDHVEFVGYDVPNSNPIWGRFERYAEAQAYVNKSFCRVQYANHLDELSRLFVVTKELCHSLHTHEGTHSVSNSSVVNLITKLSLASANNRSINPNQPYMAEQIAEFGALEILIPVEKRQQYINNGRYPSDHDHQALANELGCPTFYLDYIFNPQIIALSLKILP